MELDRTEARVLGALVEKRWTVPDQYPLSLNALVAACNQKSNRNPVLQLLEFEISGCLMGLRQRGLVVVHEQFGGRVPRHGEKLMDELRVSRQAIAILAELLLRGPQTAGELVRRCARMAHFENQGQVDALLRDLAGGHLVRLEPKASGQRYARWGQLLTTDGPDDGPDDGPSDDGADDGAQPTTAETTTGPQPRAPDSAHALSAATSPPPAAPAPAAAAAAPSAPDDVTALRSELAALRADVAALRERVETLESLI